MRFYPKQLKPGSNGQVAKESGGIFQWLDNGLGYTLEDKNLAPAVAIVNGIDLGIRITNTPRGFVEVYRNGLLIKLGNGTTDTDGYFVSSSGGLGFTKLAQGTAGAGQLAIVTSGELWAWGNGASGRNGDNSLATRSSPVSVLGNHSFVQCERSDSNGGAIKADGTGWCWGLGTSGQVGDFTAASKSSPVSVVGEHVFAYISIGTNTNGGLRTDGTVWMWGVGTSGQLGQNAVAASRSSPTSVVGDHSFIRLCCNGTSVAALKADGSIWAWGLGTSGQIGDNTSASKSSPTSIVGGHSFIAIDGGSNHFIALKADGTIWGWGLNTTGQLGDNTSSSRSSPVSLIGDHSFIEISAGLTTSHARKADGTMWGWGLNTVGYIGDNTTTTRSSPVLVAGNHSFINIASNGSSSFGLKDNGECWGWGTQLETGENTAFNRSSPISVIGSIAGATPRSYNQIVAGDRFVWNAIISGSPIAATDNFDLLYVL